MNDTGFNTRVAYVIPDWHAEGHLCLSTCVFSDGIESPLHEDKSHLVFPDSIEPPLHKGKMPF
jgi:hypothetical protein